MERDKLDMNGETTNLHIKREANDQVLEISSTGYGLESVSRREVAEGKNEMASPMKEQPFVENNHE
ncbi:hypothetical protein [Pseudobacillus wudalianchiensis]|uniref:Uncharacterized protein n=1 Tax=Pseudobacillus wudalianchiensis TaxID=1743143 RepID=A0A1B9AUC4_9BACI|nr:hypothetical protein [Bacillus wudalianchiensis]OCA87394.1 hypothetical protein A8F95_09175 [Bacillus wudalianchiensis]